MKANLKKTLIIIPLGFIVITGIFFAYVNSSNFIRKHIIPLIEEKTHFDIESKEIDFSLLSGELNFKDLEAKSGPNTIHAETLEIKINLWDFINKNYQVEKIILENAQLNINFDATGRLKSNPKKAKTISLKPAKPKPTNKTKRKPNIAHKPISLPHFLVQQITIRNTELALHKADRYGKLNHQHLKIASLEITKLGTGQKFELACEGAYMKKSHDAQYFSTEEIIINSTGTFDQTLSSAKNKTSISIAQISTDKIKSLQDLALQLELNCSMEKAKLTFSDCSISSTKAKDLASKIDFNAEIISEDKLKARIKILKLNSTLLDIALSFSPKSKSIPRWQKLTQQAGLPAGFVNTQINGDITVDKNDSLIHSEGELKLNNFPITTKVNNGLQKEEINSKLNFDLRLVDKTIQNVKLSLSCATSNKDSLLSIDTTMRQDTINGTINSKNFDLSLLNNFTKSEDHIEGRLNSRISLTKDSKKSTGHFNGSLEKLKHKALSGKTLNTSLDFTFLYSSLKTVLNNLEFKAHEPSSARLTMNSKEIIIHSKKDFSKNEIHTDNIQIKANTYPSLSPDIIPQQVLLSLDKLSVTQSQEMIQSQAQFKLSGAKIHEHNNIVANGSIKLNANLLESLQILNLDDFSITNQGRPLAFVHSLRLENQIKNTLQKTNLHIPKFVLNDLQCIPLLQSNTIPKFKDQKISSEVNLKLSKDTKDKKLSYSIDFPSIKIMELTPFSLSTNFNQDKGINKIQNFSLVQGPHILNLNATFSKDHYKIENFNGSLDLAFISSILKSLDPNFHNTFFGLINLNSTQIESYGSSPEELLLNLKKGAIDWDISKLNLSLQQKEKTFISKTLGFKPDSLQFDKGALKAEFKAGQIDFKALKLMGDKGGFDFYGKVYKDQKNLKSQFFIWSSFVGSDYLHYIPPQTILDNINEIDDFLNYNPEKKWFEFDEHIELVSEAKDGTFATLIEQIKFNAESKFGPYIAYLESAKKLSQGKLDKQSAKSILDIFKGREEERQQEREKKGKKRKESNTQKVLDLLDGFL
ncbi:hypothetical protein PQO03_01185 [Lentisphaera profundi]|uniref:AsmA-like C-terminal domain-containing protein n=1 Tax=Lentisphaera profundi TaxID=1658616 RepID=A0ABY7VTM5_9BACT|nr:hypothetical protein [Lentisphaera profundi]WDE96580.1 hypothetical protein PQO03_01185 [Lentisphaera profundi]